jgi:hypothetical protein
MTVEERAFRDVALRLYCANPAPTRALREDFDQRPIVVSPYDGAYGFGGCVVCIEGSPPRGTFLVPQFALKCGLGSRIGYMRVCTFREIRGRRTIDVVVGYLRSIGWGEYGLKVDSAKPDQARN